MMMMMENSAVRLASAARQHYRYGDAATTAAASCFARRCQLMSNPPAICIYIPRLGGGGRIQSRRLSLPDRQRQPSQALNKTRVILRF